MIGYYGGSFNPVHTGHIEIAKYISQSKLVDKVLLTPTLSHPFDKEIVDFSQRLDMVKLATNELENVGFSDIEKIRAKQPSYTIDLLKYLKKIDDGSFFIAGLDNFNSFFLWKDWELILKNFNIVFTTRAGIILNKQSLEKIETVINKKIEFKNIFEFNPKGVSFLKVPEIYAASVNVRKMLIDNKNCSGIIHTEVLDYIKHHKLFLKK